MKPSEQLKALGLELPPVAAAVGAYVPATKTGKLIYTAGQLPFKGGTLIATGKVPAAVDLATAQSAARQAVLNALSAAAAVACPEAKDRGAGSLDKIARIIRLNVFVNSSAGFTDQAKVANGASELLTQIFGDAGRHTRCAVGAAELPLNAPVEVDLIAEME